MKPFFNFFKYPHGLGTKCNVIYDPYAMIFRRDNNWTVGDCGSSKLEKTDNSFTYSEKLLKKLYSGLTHLPFAGFSLHFFWKEKKYMKSIMLSLSTDCRLQRHLWHRTATCSIYNYVVWVCTRTTALSCYLLMINDVIHYL